MHVVDVNVLLYANNSESPDHEAALGWLEQALHDIEAVGLSWLTLLGFVRISTLRSLHAAPLTVSEAFDQVDWLLRQPAAVVVEPGPHHSGIVRELLLASGTASNLANDAHLAALAIENGGDIVSFDRDFARFRTVRWIVPTPP